MLSPYYRHQTWSTTLCIGLARSQGAESRQPVRFGPRATCSRTASVSVREYRARRIQKKGTHAPGVPKPFSTFARSESAPCNCALVSTKGSKYQHGNHVDRYQHLVSSKKKRFVFEFPKTCSWLRTKLKDYHVSQCEAATTGLAARALERWMNHQQIINEIQVLTLKRWGIERTKIN